MKKDIYSSLCKYKKISPNKSTRTHAIDTITIHVMAGDLSVETCGNVFSSTSRQASSNYGIDSSGNIAVYVPENYRSWCSSNRSNDDRAITIEVANDKGAETGYHVTDKALTSLINLLVDVCKRNGIKQLLWKGDKKLIGQISKQNMTVHRWFSNKACPGDYLYNKHDYIAKSVNARLTSSSTATTKQKETTSKKKSNMEIAKEVIAGKWGNGNGRKAKLEKAGYDYKVVQREVNRLLKK